ncbi:hypothetical protein MTO96_003854 [Rhipicephalus appendiculatus]
MPSFFVLRSPASCLQEHLVDGCSHQDMMALTALENAIEAVRSAACGDGRALLKSQRSFMPEAKLLLAKLLSKFNMESTKPVEVFRITYELVLKDSGSP